jgi:ComF family protein
MEFITDPLCQYCGDPLMYPTDLMECTSCFAERPKLRHRSVWRYTLEAKQLVFRFKYQNQTWLTEFFGHQLMRIMLKYFPETTVLVPVPLHPKRLSERGFNQALLLARWLSKHTGVPVNYWSLKRSRYTPSQGTKTAQERRSNVENVFMYHPVKEMYDANILLIDDVYTTGSTLQACALVLADACPKSIHSITLTKSVFSTERQIEGEDMISEYAPHS